jgi:hypothetical protein
MQDGVKFKYCFLEKGSRLIFGSLKINFKKTTLFYKSNILLPLSVIFSDFLIGKTIGKLKLYL